MKRVVMLLLVFVLSLGLLGCSKDEQKPNENIGGEETETNLMGKYKEELAKFNELITDVEVYFKSKGQNYAFDPTNFQATEVSNKYIKFTANIKGMDKFVYKVEYKISDGELSSIIIDSPFYDDKNGPEEYGDLWQGMIEGTLRSKYTGITVDENNAIVANIDKVIDYYKDTGKDSNDLKKLKLDRLDITTELGVNCSFRLYF